jgi:hypothetical protein
MVKLPLFFMLLSSRFSPGVNRSGFAPHGETARSRYSEPADFAFSRKGLSIKVRTIDN